MINVFLVWAVLSILFVYGVFFCKLINVWSTGSQKEEVYLIPLIGLIGIINIIELCNLFIPVQIIAIFLFITIIYIGVWLRREIFSAVMLLCKNKSLLVLMFVASVLFSYPVMIQNELVSFQVENNDIMYYLSSMDWLASHTSTEEVIYSDNAPFYWCAEYMLERTRIGFDGFGAFIMCLFGLQAHQVFSDLGILFIVLSIPSMYYLLGVVLRIKEKKRNIYIVIALLGSGWGEQLIYQYVPQILGIVCLMTFIGVAILFLLEEQKDKGMLMAWILAGTVAVYAEFAAYLFVIYLCLCGIIVHRRKSLMRIKVPIVYGFVGLLLNPIGIYRGIKLNLFVLMNAQGSMENIDPYAGNIMEYYNAFGKMFGLLPCKENDSNLSMFIMILLIESIGVVLVLFVSYGIWIKDNYKTAFLGITGFFIGYEIYFRNIRYAYGEYKHLLTIAGFMILMLLYILDKLQDIHKYRKWILAMEWSAIGIIGICGCFHIGNTVLRKDLYFYNHELIELADAACLLPQEEVMGISGSPATIHGEVYALRDRNGTILANNISYYPFSFLPSTRYRVYEGNHLSEENEKIVWSNGRFTIVENTGLQSCFYSGFHALDDLTSEDRWTCDKESSIVIHNYSDEEKEVSLCFGTDAKNVKNIKVMYNGRVIARAESGQQIVTESILLEKNQEAKIYIYTEEDLDVLGEKTVGIEIQNYMLLDYSGQI